MRAYYPRSESVRRATGGRPWGELYAEYHAEAHDAPASTALLVRFDEIRNEVSDAAS